MCLSFPTSVSMQQNKWDASRSLRFNQDAQREDGLSLHEFSFHNINIMQRKVFFHMRNGWFSSNLGWINSNGGTPFANVSLGFHWYLLPISSVLLEKKMLVLGKLEENPMHKLQVVLLHTLKSKWAAFGLGLWEKKEKCIIKLMLAWFKFFMLSVST